MRIVADVFKELFDMFVADAKLTLAILLLVAAVAGLVIGLRAGPYLAGGVLLLGCLAILVEAARRETRARMCQ